MSEPRPAHPVTHPAATPRSAPVFPLASLTLRSAQEPEAATQGARRRRSRNADGEHQYPAHAQARLLAQSRDVPRAIIAAHQLAQQMAHQLSAPVVLAAPVKSARRVVVATACVPVMPALAARLATPMPSSPLVP